MTRYLPLITLLAPAFGEGVIPHISERNFKDGKFGSMSRDDRAFGDDESSPVPAENFKKCRMDTSDNLYNYFSEDIEKKNNVSLADYEGNVTLVVNLASF